MAESWYITQFTMPIAKLVVFYNALPSSELYLVQQCQGGNVFTTMDHVQKKIM
jgi:hypothetical protein